MPTWLATRTTNPTTSPESGLAIPVDTEPSPLGAWLRRERERRSWTRAEMSRRLIKAAEENDDYSMPGVNPR
jgi:hypothetical protein